MRSFRVMSCLIVLVLSVLGAAAQDSLSVESGRPRGFDAGRLVHAPRTRAEHRSIFLNDVFRDNFSLSVVSTVQTPRNVDYGFLNSAGLAVQKWFAPSVGARVDLMGGYMYGNRYGDRIPHVSTSASVLFNISSYVDGYDLMRFCDVSAVLGVGYACEWDGGASHFFTGNIGINVNMRIAPRVCIMVEPSVPFRVCGSELFYGFATSVGLSCDMSEQKYEPARAGKWFVYASGGLQVQNSALVKQTGSGSAVGFCASAGVGRRFDDFFALRLSAVYSRHIWAVYYGGYRMPADYYALRLEGILDVVRLALRNSYDGRFGCGVILGPELGYMVKKDVGYSLKRQYVGLTAGLHADCRLGKRLTLFLEPRFTLVPYTAPNDDSTSFNVNRNYYDGLFNFVAGIEIKL